MRYLKARFTKTSNLMRWSFSSSWGKVHMVVSSWSQQKNSHRKWASPDHSDRKDKVQGLAKFDDFKNTFGAKVYPKIQNC